MSKPWTSAEDAILASYTSYTQAVRALRRAGYRRTHNAVSSRIRKLRRDEKKLETHDHDMVTDA